jgi:hypothetical protein
MITVAGQKRLLSDLVASIKADPLTPWHKGYDCYLLKLNGNIYATMPDLIMALAGYVMGEKDLDSVHLARYRGNGPTLKSAMSLAPLARAKVNANDVVAINALMTTGGVGNGISDKSAHTTDPETGFPKSGLVTVSEFYVSGKDGRRATKRTEGQTTSYYYSKSHVANTYEYARLV